MLVCKSRCIAHIIQHTKVSILITVSLFKMAYNGKRLCEGGAFTPKISIKTAPSKNHFRFFKITKK